MVKNLKLLRERRGLTQAALGQALGISQQAVNKYENHSTEPDIDMLIKIADVFKTSIDYLVGRTELSEEGASYDFSCNGEEMKVLETYRELSDIKRDAILHTLEAFKVD